LYPQPSPFPSLLLSYSYRSPLFLKKICTSHTHTPIHQKKPQFYLIIVCFCSAFFSLLPSSGPRK
jgi:hypothetical protein